MKIVVDFYWSVLFTKAVHWYLTVIFLTYFLQAFRHILSCSVAVKTSKKKHDSKKSLRMINCLKIHENSS